LLAHRYGAQENEQQDGHEVFHHQHAEDQAGECLRLHAQLIESADDDGR
jgi:hypothetical protein